MANRQRGGSGVARGRAAVAVVLGIAAATWTARVAADTVTAKGTVLRGTITSVTSGGLVLDSEYGKGSIAIKWEDIEDVTSDGAFQILYDDAELYAPLQGVRGSTVLVGASPDTATAVDVAAITSGVPIGPDGPTWQDRLRSSWRYWDGNFDLAFNLQQATTDTLGLLIGAGATRKKDNLRLIFAATYRYGTESRDVTTCPEGATCPPDRRTTTRQSSTLQDQWYGLGRGEYAFTSRWYGFGSGEATYDAIQRLSIRAVPKAGMGYTFWERVLDEDRRDYLSGEVGPAWVYERYFGGDHRDYVAVGFGAAAGYHLPYGAHFTGRVDYLPAIDDFVNDYLLRSEAALIMPLVEPISAKFSVVDVYDNTPAPGARPNSLFIAIGLSVSW